MKVAPLLVRLPIFVNADNPLLCRESSSDPETDGCPSMTYDDEGDRWCGAFGQHLAQVDSDDCELDYYRLADCLDAEIK